MKKIFLLAALAGACTNFVALGIGRYAYTPMIPHLVREKWLTLSHANTLATILYIGFLLSVCFSSMFFKKYSKTKIIQYSMIIMVVSFIGASFNFGALWLGIWIFIMGIQTGIIFLNAPTLILTTIPDNLKGFISGIMFMGIGIGVVISSVLAEHFGNTNIKLLWLILAIFMAISVALSWKLLPIDNNDKINAKEKIKSKIPIKLVTGFFLFRMGNLALTVYLSEYVALKYAHPEAINATSFALLGAGFIIGPFLFGYISKFIGVKLSLLISLLCLAIGTIIMCTSFNPTTLYIFSFVGGLGVPATAGMFSGLNSIISTSETIYKNWKYILISGSISLFVGMIVFNLILKSSGYSMVFLVAGIIVFVSIIILIIPEKKKALS